MNPYFDTSIIRAAETPTRGMGSERRALLANFPFHAHYGRQEESERQLSKLQPTLAGEIQKPRQTILPLFPARCCVSASPRRHCNPAKRMTSNCVQAASAQRPA
jgi:hypothetical protein